MTIDHKQLDMEFCTLDSAALASSQTDLLDAQSICWPPADVACVASEVNGKAADAGWTFGEVIS